MATDAEVDRLVVRLVGDASSYRKMMREARATTGKATREMDRLQLEARETGSELRRTGLSSKIMEGGLNRAKIAAAGLVASLGAVGSAAVAMAIKLAAEGEQVQIAFEVMTGSASVATRLIQDLRTMGARTPFETRDLSQATKTLLAFGRPVKDVLSDLDMLSNVAAGDAERLKSLALVFGQIAANEKLMGQDLLQLINVGFNPLQEISRKTGESMTELRERMSKGAISFHEVRRAFKDATSEGGRFFEMNDKQSRSLIGRWSTVKDEMSETLRIIGVEIVDAFDLTGVLKGVADFLGDIREDTQSTLRAIRSETSGAVESLESLKEAFEDLAPVMKELGSVASETLAISFRVLVNDVQFLAGVMTDYAETVAKAVKFTRELGQFELRMPVPGGGSLGEMDIFDPRGFFGPLGLDFGSEIDAAKEAAGVGKEIAKELEESRKPMAAGAAQKKAVERERDHQKAIRDTIAELRKQADTFGMSERQLLQYELAQMGVVRGSKEWIAALEQFDRLDAMRRQKEAMDEQVKAMQEARREYHQQQDAIHGTIQALIDQRNTFGKSTAEIELYRLKQMGASQIQLDTARSILEQIEALEGNKKATEDAKRATEEARRAEERFRNSISGFGIQGVGRGFQALQRIAESRRLRPAGRDVAPAPEPGRLPSREELGSAMVAAINRNADKAEQMIRELREIRALEEEQANREGFQVQAADL